MRFSYTVMIGPIGDPSLRHRAWLFTPSSIREEVRNEEGLRKVQHAVAAAAAAPTMETGSLELNKVEVEGKWGPGVHEARARLVEFNFHVGRGVGRGGDEGERGRTRGGKQRHQPQTSGRSNDEVVVKEEEEEEEEGEAIQSALVAWIGKVMHSAFSMKEEEEGGKQVPTLNGLVLESLTFQQRQQQGWGREGQLWVVEDPYSKSRKGL